MTEESDWVLTDFECPSSLGEIVGSLLWEAGVAAVEEISRSGDVVLRTSVPSHVAAEIAALHPQVNISTVRIPRAVAETWRAHARPTRVTDGVWLVPAWCDPSGEGQHVLIEPFDTFGLGNHPSTILALRLLLDAVGPADLVCDVGSGSGVLAVAAATVAGAQVEALDISPGAAVALEHNARLNGVDALVSWRGPLGAKDRARYGVVVANILAPVLGRLADDIENAVADGGAIVLSGLRDDQVEGVVTRFRSSTVVLVEHLDGWAGVRLARDAR